MGRPVTDASALLVRALREPVSVDALDSHDWTVLLAAARAEQLIASLAFRVEGRPMPAPPPPSPRPPPAAAAAILADARKSAAQGKILALWEAEMAHRTLEPLDVPVILLKGTAFVAAGLEAGEGRYIGDLDILVPNGAIRNVEKALIDAGWEWVKDDPYDSHYYRSWMHELPPLIHRERDRMIDVHHTILPPSARRKPHAAALIANSVELPNGLRTLSSHDMIIHAAAHLFADGDLAGGLRNLWDIDRLVRQFAEQPDFWPWLARHARLHDLEVELGRALRLADRLYGTPVDGSVAGAARLADHLYERRLLARDGWGRPTRRLTRLAFYVRSHWIRMPPRLLARHLWVKAWKNPAAV